MGKWIYGEPLHGRARNRYLQLFAAATLGFSLSGWFLVSALNHPGDPAGWVVLGVWVLVFCVTLSFAWRRFRRDASRRESMPEDDRLSRVTEPRNRLPAGW